MLEVTVAYTSERQAFGRAIGGFQAVQHRLADHAVRVRGMGLLVREAARASRDCERKDTREEGAKALADLKAKGMQVNELSPAEAGRMRDKLTNVNASIAWRTTSQSAG